MTKSELLELISNGESSGIEFKLDRVRPAQLAKEIVAFANFRGGRVLLGVGDNGTVVGVKRNNLEQWLMDTVFGRYVHPMIVPFYEEVPIDGQRQVAVVEVSQGISKPYVVREQNREKFYVRIGSKSRLATREQRAWLYTVSGMHYAELLPVSGTKLADFSRGRLRHYVASVMEDPIIPVDDGEWQTRLCNLGFMVERENAPNVGTLAGLVLFGQLPKRVLPQAGIRWMAFDGKEKSYSALDDQVIDGPLVPLRKLTSAGDGYIVEKGVLDRLIDVMRPFIAVDCKSVDTSMRRERKWLYPLEAIREAVVNAVAHRDWTRKEDIEIVRYKDRLEVQSPGDLPNSMTMVKMIAGQRSPRNPLIVNVLRDYGYVDARGMGVRNKIIPLLKEHNGTVPKFHVTEDYVRVTMYQG